MKQIPSLCLQTKSGSEGSGWFGQELAQAIAQTGTKVIYVAPAAVPKEREPRSSNPRRFVTPSNVSEGGRLGRTISSLRRIWGGWLGCFVARAETRDYLFSIPDPLLFFIPLQILLRLTGARVHLVVHDALPHSWLFSERFRPLQKGAVWLSYMLCTSLFPTTKSGCGDLLHHFGLSNKRIVVVPHGAYLLDEVSTPPNSKSFLLFGTLRRNKGIKEAIQGVQLCRKNGLAVSLHIAGAPDKADLAYWQDCVSQIASAPDGITTTIGFIPDEDVPRMIAEADAVLLPYREFTSQSGVAVLMVSGARPVIASNIGGIADLFEQGMTGIPLSTEPKADEIASALKCFCTVPSHDWYSRALHARELVNQKIGWAPIGHKYIDAIFPTSRQSGRGNN